jgi:hypothetical protein
MLQFSPARKEDGLNHNCMTACALVFCRIFFVGFVYFEVTRHWKYYALLYRGQPHNLYRGSSTEEAPGVHCRELSRGPIVYLLIGRRANNLVISGLGHLPLSYINIYILQVDKLYP